MRNSNVNISVEIVEQLVVLEPRSSGWNLELNVVSWNGEAPKYDIRPWNEDHSQCGKGITLTEDNLKKVVAYCEEAQLSAI